MKFHKKDGRDLYGFDSKVFANWDIGQTLYLDTVGELRACDAKDAEATWRNIGYVASSTDFFATEDPFVAMAIQCPKRALDDYPSELVLNICLSHLLESKEEKIHALLQYYATDCAARSADRRDDLEMNAIEAKRGFLGGQLFHQSVVEYREMLRKHLEPPSMKGTVHLSVAHNQVEVDCLLKNRFGEKVPIESVHLPEELMVAHVFDQDEDSFVVAGYIHGLTSDPLEVEWHAAAKTPASTLAAFWASQLQKTEEHDGSLLSEMVFKAVSASRQAAPNEEAELEWQCKRLAWWLRFKDLTERLWLAYTEDSDRILTFCSHIF